MVIRPLTLADLPALQDFYGSLTEAITYFFRPWAEPTEEVLRDHLADGQDGRALVRGLFSADGQVEGHAFIRWLGTEHPSFGIALRERAQGQGSGRRLTEAILAAADGRGVPEVYLGVNKDNPRACALYQSLGWTIIGEIESNCPDGSWRMVRPRLGQKDIPPRKDVGAMLIRQLTLADLPALQDFYGSLTPTVTYFFQPWPEFTEEVLREHLTDADAGKNCVLAVISAEGAVEGHGFMWNVDSDKPVLGIGLRERAQGQGWGRRLMEALLAEADARRLPAVHLTVLKANVRALPLYESVGFVVEDETKFRAENDSLCMARRREW